MQEQPQKAEGGPVGFSSNEQQQFVSDQQEAYNYTMGSLYVGDLAPEVRNLSPPPPSCQKPLSSFNDKSRFYLLLLLLVKNPSQ